MVVTSGKWDNQDMVCYLLLVFVFFFFFQTRQMIITHLYSLDHVRKLGKTRIKWYSFGESKAGLWEEGSGLAPTYQCKSVGAQPAVGICRHALHLEGGEESGPT